MGWVSMALVWLLSRALVLWLFFGPHGWVTGDTAYFADSLARVPDVGLQRTLVEYPLPGVALVALPWLAARGLGAPDVYSEVVLALALATDAAFTVLLRRFAAGRSAAVWAWLLAVPLLGATTYARFDLVPGVLAGTAVLLLGPFPRIAGMAVAAATGLKLWPALLLPALAARQRERRRLVGVVAAIGAVLFVGSVVLAGWARLVSPLAWQADRGLQIESVLATPVMLAWAVEPGPHVVGYSEFNAFEITGPGVAALLVAGTVSTVLIAIGLILLWVRAWHRADTLTHDGVVWLGLAAVTAFMVSSRVLSPQYLLWLLPLAAAGLAVVRTARGLRRLRRWVTVLLVTTLATQLVFPVFYGNLTVHTEDSYGVVLLVAARNVALVWLLVEAAREAWWQLRTAPGQGQRGIELERQPPGPEGNDARTLR